MILMLAATTPSLTQGGVRMACSRLSISQGRSPTLPLMKETTLDRLTGPKLFKTVTRWEGIHSVPIVPLRVLTGVLMIHHGNTILTSCMQLPCILQTSICAFILHGQRSALCSAGSEGGFWPANYGTPGFNGFVDFIIKPYFSFLPGEPELWSAIHDYAEFWGGALFAVGLFTRPAALTLFGTMVTWPDALPAVPSFWRADGTRPSP